MTLLQRLLNLIDRSGVSDHRISQLATGSTDTVRNLRRGSIPRIDTVETLGRALGLRLQFVPLEESSDPDPAPAVETRPQWANRLREEMRRDLAQVLNQANSPEIPARVLQAPIHEMPAAAGDISDDFDESVAGHITFSPRWLNRHGLFPPICTIIAVKGDSMEPTLPHGSYILVDRRLPQLKHDRLFVFRTGQGLVVKRLKQDEDGVWWLVSDNPAWKPVRFSDRAQLIGEVRWAGRLL